MIIPNVAIGQVRGIHVRDDVHNVEILSANGTVSAGKKLSLVGYKSTTGSALEVKNKGHATSTIVFPNSLEVFGGKPVISTLSKSIQLTVEALNILESVAWRYVKGQRPPLGMRVTFDA